MAEGEVSVEEIADAMYKMIEQDMGKKKYKAMHNAIQNDLIASETIHIALNPRRLKINVLGDIFAPKVTISFRSFFS